MSTTMHSRAPRAPTSPVPEPLIAPSAIPAAADRLRMQTAAVRVSFTWLGVRKTLSREQKSEAAESFGAEGAYLSAAKKLLDTRHPAYRSVTAVRGRAIAYWRGTTLPYPDPGLRLLRQDAVEAFNLHMQRLHAQLIEAVKDLDRHYEPLRLAARERLGRLYDPQDYPPSLMNLFDVAWEFPSVEPPQYLLQLRPELYEQERARMAARFEEAVSLAEQAFASELSNLITHLVERLSGSSDGKPKVFRDSAVVNLSEFFERFRQLSIHSSPELDELVERARRVVSGIEPHALREGPDVRRRVQDGLTKVSSLLEGLLVDKPRRRILRASSSSSSSNNSGGNAGSSEGAAA